MTLTPPLLSTSPDGGFRVTLPSVVSLAALSVLLAGMVWNYAAGRADDSHRIAPTGAWEWIGGVAADGTSFDVDEPSRYVLRLTDDGGMAVRSDCNWLAGRGLGTTSQELRMLGSPSTCPGPSDNARFITLLGNAAAVRVDDIGNLIIRAGSGESLQLRPVVDSAEAGP